MLLNCGVGEDSWESLGLQETQPVHPKGNQSWIFIGRTDAEAETPILWAPDAKSWLIWKDSDAGKAWGQEEKGTIEDEMVEWHHLLKEHEFGWTLGVDDGQGGLACCCSWGHKESDMTEWLNWTELRLLSPLEIFLKFSHSLWIRQHSSFSFSSTQFCLSHNTYYTQQVSVCLPNSCIRLRDW